MVFYKSTVFGLKRNFVKRSGILSALLKTTVKLYSCVKFQCDCKIPKKYRFLGTLPVFFKNNVNYECSSEQYSQSSVLVPYFRMIANFQKNTGFSGFSKFFEKNTEDSEYISEKCAEISIPM